MEGTDRVTTPALIESWRVEVLMAVRGWCGRSGGVSGREVSEGATTSFRAARLFSSHSTQPTTCCTRSRALSTRTRPARTGAAQRRDLSTSAPSSSLDEEPAPGLVVSQLKCVLLTWSALLRVPLTLPHRLTARARPRSPIAPPRRPPHTPLDRLPTSSQPRPSPTAARHQLDPRPPPRHATSRPQAPRHRRRPSAALLAPSRAFRPLDCGPARRRVDPLAQGAAR